MTNVETMLHTEKDQLTEQSLSFIMLVFRSIMEETAYMLSWSIQNFLFIIY